METDRPRYIKNSWLKMALLASRAYRLMFKMLLLKAFVYIFPIQIYKLYISYKAHIIKAEM